MQNSPDQNSSVVLSDTTTVTGWKKSSFSSGTGENCTEVASFPGLGVAVRNNRDLAAPGLLFDKGEWSAFLAGVKAGEFDADMI